LALEGAVAAGQVSQSECRATHLLQCSGLLASNFQLGYRLMCCFGVPLFLISMDDGNRRLVRRGCGLLAVSAGSMANKEKWMWAVCAGSMAHKGKCRYMATSTASTGIQKLIPARMNTNQISLY